MWDDYLDSIPTADSIAASYAVPIPPIAGGQFPNPVDAVRDAWGWASGTILGPAADTLADLLTNLGKIVFDAVTTFAGWVLRHLYSWVWHPLIDFVPEEQRWRFPDPLREGQRDAWTYLSRVFQIVFWTIWGQTYRYFGWTMNWLRRVAVDTIGDVGGLFGWLRDRVTDAASWLRSRFLDLLGLAGTGFSTLVSWIDARVGDAASWLHARFLDLLGLAGTGFSTLVSWIDARVGYAASWLWGRLQDALSGIGSAGSALITTISGPISDAASWLWDQIRPKLDDIWTTVTKLPSFIVNLPGNFWDTLSGFVSDAASWLWDQIRPKLDDIWSAVSGLTAAGGQFVLAPLVDILLEVFNRLLEPVVDTLAAKLAIPARALGGEFPTFQSFMDALMDPPTDVLKGVGFFAWALIVTVASFMVGFIPAFRPVNERWAQETSRAVRETIPSLRDLIDMRRRGEISEAEFRDALERMGLPDWAIDGYVALLERIPSPADLIRFGIREVFTPEIRQRFGLDQDFPEDFARFMSLQGYPEDWAKAYWAAHWELPSVQQGFEMFHRGVIDQNDLRTLLRAQDIMPFWRDRLTDIAYRVITRVDVRRMYQAGVISRDKVLRTYLDQGYRPEDAQALTDWVVREYAPVGAAEGASPRQLTVSAIKQAYARRLIERDEAIERLQALGYSPDSADLYVSIWDFDFYVNPDQRSEVAPKALSRSLIARAYARGLIDFNRAASELEEQGYTPEDARLILELEDLRQAEELSDLETEMSVQRYRAGLITDAQLAADLQSLNVPQRRIDLILQREILRRQVKTRTLTVSQLQRALRRGAITEDEFRSRLDAMGYNAEDIDILVAIT